MSQIGDCVIQPHSALPPGDQETQEHAHYLSAILGCWQPAGATFLEKKRSQPAGIKAAWLSKAPEQFANINPISVESHIASTSLLAHPLTKGRQQSGIVNWGLDGACGDDRGTSQVGYEQTCTTDDSPVICMTVVWTAASTQVAVELRKRLLVQLTHRHAVPIRPVDEMLRGAKVYTSNPPGVPCLR